MERQAFFQTPNSSEALRLVMRLDGGAEAFTHLTKNKSRRRRRSQAPPNEERSEPREETTALLMLNLSLFQPSSTHFNLISVFMHPWGVYAASATRRTPPVEGEPAHGALPSVSALLHRRRFAPLSIIWKVQNLHALTPLRLR